MNNYLPYKKDRVNLDFDVDIMLFTSLMYTLYRLFKCTILCIALWDFSCDALASEDFVHS